jgi:hypothetical protein
MIIIILSSIRHGITKRVPSCIEHGANRDIRYCPSLAFKYDSYNIAFATLIRSFSSRRCSAAITSKESLDILGGGRDRFDDTVEAELHADATERLSSTDTVFGLFINEGSGDIIESKACLVRGVILFMDSLISGDRFLGGKLLWLRFLSHSPPLRSRDR